MMTPIPSTDSPTLSGGEATRLRTDTERLLALLHRGGHYAHLWTDAGNRSFWFPVDPANEPEPAIEFELSTRAFVTAQGMRRGQRARRKPLQQVQRYVPKQWLRHNVYFSVHPLSQIPPQNTSGLTDPRFISSQSNYIAAVNVLFAEFDGKDFVYARDFQRALPANVNELSPVAQQQAVKSAQEAIFYQTMAPFKARALRLIASLPFAPSVIIDSGGGYHCYWLLRHTVPLDDANRDDVQVVQHSWVQFVGGDRGAADLRRVLRLPGTYNHKPGLREPQRVVFVKSDFGLLYEYRELEEAVNDWRYEQARRQRQFRWQARRRRNAAPPTLEQPAAQDYQITLRQQYNAQQPIEDLLLRHGYQRAGTGRGLIRLSRPGRNRLHSSVTIFGAEENGRPELSIHFSTNDPLYSQEYVDAESGKVRRHLNDAFHIYVMLEHNGHWDAAYQAWEKKVGQTNAANS